METVVSKKEIEKIQRELIEEISKVEDRSSFLQSFSKIKFRKEKQGIYELFFSFLIKSESISPGSSEIFFDILSSKGTQETLHPKPLSRENLFSLIKTFCDKDALLVKRAIELSGLEGKITLARGISTEKDSCELKNGSFFESAIPGFRMQKSKFLDAKIVCVDGFVEKVSEIHHLLEKSSESKDPCIMFLRGASDEVIHTLKTNFDRKTLIFIPILVSYDVDGANLLNDVAVSSGTDVVSSLKGDLISSIQYEKLGRVDSVEISEEGVVIENSSSRMSLDFHINFLQKKVIDASSEAERSAIEKRIKRLGSRKVVISLKDEKTFEKRSFSIDKSLRAVKKSTDHGVVEYKGKIYPFSSIEAGKFFSRNFLDTIQSIETMII